jgi:hypothetical protein
MAKATEDALPIARQQAWVGWLSFGGVLISLFVAGYAAWASQQSAKSAKTSADEARAANILSAKSYEAAYQSFVLAKRQFELSFKPWLAVEMTGPYVEWDANLNPPQYGGIERVPIKASITITNVSDVPAIITHVSLTLVADISEHAGSDPSRVPEIYKYVGKGDTFEPKGFILENFANFWLTKVNMGSFWTKRRPISGKIIYIDPLQKRRELSFAFIPDKVHATRFDRWGGTQYNYDRDIGE